MPTKFTVPEPETDNDTLQSEEEDYSSGNGRLALIVGAILLFAVIGYMLLPGSSGRRVVTTIIPSVMLGEASVTGAKEVAPEAPAEEAATEEETAAEAVKLSAADAKKPVVRPAAEAGLAARTAESVAPLVAATAETAPAAEASPAAAAAPATVTLSGRILDEDGRPMAGATVLLKGSRKGTGTDANGNYTLEVPAGENALVYGYGGYQDQEVRTRGSQPVNVTLLPSEGTKRRRK
ncbi:carboxypeptidase-like regulatory domain-containing protein [Hymenobacter sp. BT190]|uniref:carboxypeptidase-like regulatory domain-containing protein n=1 Tax=Hymenobacter sp. BT190 TaxID=2763505 RepID=UPI001650E6FB|nr:carboxypeptidase-like regulatory domain-containing protein [Hymenobacter sp. BT190]MBC6699554.1 carboxypeptidase-like regulatory domain-containing protein [Hymenobacter sp. BT190]